MSTRLWSPVLFPPLEGLGYSYNVMIISGWIEVIVKFKGTEVGSKLQDMIETIREIETIKGNGTQEDAVSLKKGIRDD